MEIIEISENNIDMFTGYIHEDMAENIGRVFYRGLAAVENGMVCAAMIWEYLNLESGEDNEGAIRFFRAEDSRPALLMLEEYSDRVRKENVKLSTVVISLKDHKTEKDLLGQAGFSMKLTESDQIIVSLSELLELPLMKSGDIPGGIISLCYATARQFRNGISKCLANGKKGLCEDLKYLQASFFEERVSCCYEKDGEINGFLLVHALPSGMISVQLMICMDDDVKSILGGMIRKSLLSLDEEYTRDTKVVLNRHNQATLLLMEKLMPREFGIPVYSGCRKEI